MSKRRSATTAPNFDDTRNSSGNFAKKLISAINVVMFRYC